MTAPIRCALFDLDGVIRHFDPQREAEAASALGWEPGAVAARAFRPELCGPLVVGRCTRAEWVVRVGEALGNAAVATTWLDDRGTVDPVMVELVGAVRAGGNRVALLTNGTDTIADELDHLGIAALFDDVFNTWHIGVAKPDPAIYAHVCRTIRVEPNELVFFDDSLSNVVAAQGFGLRAHRFESAAECRRRLRQDGVAVGPTGASG
jgi:putative hydrolase of the HAD superfamily